MSCDVRIYKEIVINVEWSEFHHGEIFKGKSQESNIDCIN